MKAFPALVVSGLLSLSMVSSAAAQIGYRGILLSNNSILAVDSANPAAANLTAAIPVTGLIVGDSLVGIDFRPQNGMLYGLGFNSVAGTVNLYAISWRTGVASAIGPSGTFVDAGGNPVLIAGTGFGFDFNPAVDRIRVTTSTGQNFRMNPNSGAFIDGDLGGAAGSVAGLNMDGAINGGSLEASGVAYTNNQANSVVTTLYTLSATSNALFIQNPPNAGTQTSGHPITLNGLPLDFTTASGFDIMPGVNAPASNAPVPTGSAFAVLTVGGVTSLYVINLNTGVAFVSPLGNGAIPVQGFAMQGDLGGLPAISLDASGSNLVRFNTLTPGTTTTVALTSLVAGEHLVGIAWRPQTGQLFGLGFNAAVGTGSATLYRIDPQTGAATIIGLANGVADGVGTGPNLFGATSFGVDFNPAVDRIRVVTNAGHNFRINPNTGAIAGIDANLNGGTAAATGAAYTNSYGQSLTGGVTTLYVLDPVTNTLFIQNPPNNGVETLGLPITVSGLPLDFDAATGFDIPAAIQTTVNNGAVSGTAWAILTSGGITKLYRLELSTGAATPVATVTAGLNALALGDGPIVVTTTTVTASPNPVLLFTNTTLTATIAPADATGNVDFTANGVPICLDKVITSGVATCQYQASVSGDISIVATYSGDLTHAASTSAPFALHVTAGATPTTTTVSVGPNPARVGESVLLIGSVTPSNTGSSGNAGLVFFEVDGVVVGSALANNGTASFATSAIAAGSHAVKARYDGNAMLAGSTSTPVTLTVNPAATTFTQYFAEGATGNFFHTDLGIFNASKTSTAHVRVTAFPETGAPTPIDITLAPLGRRTVDLNASLGGQVGVSTLVESDQPVAATREMTWGSPAYGSTLESGAIAPAVTWYFAEGATNVFSLFYLIENPTSGPATVRLTHLLEGGASPVIQNVIVPANSRQTYYINDVPGLQTAAISTTITADVPIVAERAMYLNTSARLWEGGHAGHGATSLSQSWFFAEGATGFFHTYLLLGNPNGGSTTVSVVYGFPDGSVVSKTYDVPAQSRRTIDVNFEDPALTSATVAMSVTASLPIIAERAMYWGSPFTDGSASLGSRETGEGWAIGEGIEGGPNAEATFVLVANKSTTNPATAHFTVAYDDGSAETKDYTLPANARLTVRINADFPNSEGRRFSVLVESNPGQPITVDLARYTRDLDAGGAALATKIR